MKKLVSYSKPLTHLALLSLAILTSSSAPANSVEGQEIAQVQPPPVRQTTCRKIAATPSGITGPGVPYYRQPTAVQSGDPIGRYPVGREVRLVVPRQERRVFDTDRPDLEYVMILAIEGQTAEVWFPANVAQRFGGPPVEKGALVMCNNPGVQQGSQTTPRNTPVRGRW